MATTKNITMKQFNGTDYDTLYPKTKVEQVENLTPSSIGAVSKSGDIMTGQLNVPSFALTNYNAAIEIGKYIDFHVAGSTNDFDARLAYDAGELLFRTRSSDYKTVLHTGNLSSLGIAKSQAGSYVGTGTYGSSNPCSITFSFKPKIVIFPNDDVYNARGKAMIAVDSLTTSYQAVSGTLGYEVSAKFDTTTNTLYWYSSNSAGHQLNRAGVTYYWVAIG